MSQLQSVTDETFDQEVIKSKVPVLIDFWAEWCAPCRALTPMLEEVAQEFDGKVKIVKCNIDENEKTPSQFGVRSIPMMILFKDGKQLDQFVGRPPTKDPISTMVKKAL